MLDLFTPAQWGTLVGSLALGAIVIVGTAMIGEVFVERRRERRRAMATSDYQA